MQSEFDAHSGLKYVRTSLERSFQDFTASVGTGVKGFSLSGQPRLYWSFAGIHPKFHKSQFSKYLCFSCIYLMSRMSPSLINIR